MFYYKLVDKHHMFKYNTSEVKTMEEIWLIFRIIVLRGNIFTISFKHGLKFISYINKYVTRATNATYQIFVKERLLYEVL